MIDGWGVVCRINLKWSSLDKIHDKSTLIQVMAWCLLAASHYLSQCWPTFMSPYGEVKPYGDIDQDEAWKMVVDVVKYIFGSDNVCILCSSFIKFSNIVLFCHGSLWCVAGLITVIFMHVIRGCLISTETIERVKTTSMERGSIRVLGKNGCENNANEK